MNLASYTGFATICISTSLSCTPLSGFRVPSSSFGYRNPYGLQYVGSEELGHGGHHTRRLSMEPEKGT
eukprot:CAMPEP_0181341452 /NCGR_PEP_ID=MMETSP1101-20121128/30422_1 /TAXON_ID=46948 /ORGANISM="Rhodomonas abbreviata, Strain Caron Lab Isolate" /LENGTH=67 /DNA_ID=CAMNT_0023452739 /DNA_START=1313 /DNA_END=1516 /DNA_ORIENTATION=-